METPLEKIGAAIKTARNLSRMTQDELAAKLHVTPRHLRAVENGHQKPSYDLLCAIVHTLKLPTDDFFHPDMVHDRKELEELVTMLHYCDDKDVHVISAAVHAILQHK